MGSTSIDGKSCIDHLPEAQYHFFVDYLWIPQFPGLPIPLFRYSDGYKNVKRKKKIYFVHLSNHLSVQDNLTSILADVLHLTLLSVRIRKNKEQNHFVWTQMEIHSPKKQNVVAIWIDHLIILINQNNIEVHLHSTRWQTCIQLCISEIQKWCERYYWLLQTVFALWPGYLHSDSPIRERKRFLCRSLWGKKVEDDVWLSVFIQLMIFISPSYTFSLKLVGDCTHFEFVFLCLPLLRSTMTPPAMGLQFCI